MSTTALTAEERTVLRATAEQMRLVAKRVAPKWNVWEATEIEEQKRHGPRYSPAAWFGNGRSIPEKYRVRYLRAVQRLEAAGLLEGTGVGGRLAYLKLTAEGEAAAAELAAAQATTPVPVATPDAPSLADPLPTAAAE